MKRVLKFRTYYVSQILLYDEFNLEDTITLDYGDIAYSRGYAEAKGALAFFPILEEGLADISIWEGRPDGISKSDRRVEASIFLQTGVISIHDPEENRVELSMPPGQYLVTIIQQKTNVDGFLIIDIFLDRTIVPE